jgi:dipeptidyl aminopeptidase/acylaminoacyl peptidase
LAVSPDSKHLLTGSRWDEKDQQGIPEDNSLRLWDVETGKEISRFDDVLFPINSVAFAPDGKSIVAGGVNSMLGLWDIETGKRVRRFLAPTNVLSVAFSPDGTQVASSHRGGLKDGKWFDPQHSVIILWDVKTGREVRRLRGHTAKIHSLAFSADGRFIASVAGGGHSYSGWRDADEHTVRIWDAATGEELARTELENSAQSVVFTPDGRHVVTAGGRRGDPGHADMRLWRLPESVWPAAAQAEKPETQKVPLAAVSKRNKEHQRAAAESEELGGEVRTVEDEKSSEIFTTVGLRKQWKGGEAGFVHLKGLTNLKILDLNGTKVTDKGLVQLQGLAELWLLNLNNAEVTDAGLMHLKGLTNLEHLLLGGTEIKDAGLVHLRGLTQLRELGLKHTQVTEEGVKNLQQALPNLKTVYR